MTSSVARVSRSMMCAISSTLTGPLALMNPAARIAPADGVERTSGKRSDIGMHSGRGMIPPTPPNDHRQAKSPMTTTPKERATVTLRVLVATLKDR